MFLRLRLLNHRYPIGWNTTFENVQTMARFPNPSDAQVRPERAHNSVDFFERSSEQQTHPIGTDLHLNGVRVRSR